MRLFDMDSREDYLLGGRYMVATPYAPCVNVVEVVRCRDCKYKDIDGEITHYYWCRIHERPVDSTYYCSWGEEIEVKE